MKQIIYLLIFFLLSACTANKDEKDKIKQYLFDENSLSISEMDIECRYIPLETTDDNLFAEARYIHFYNDTLFLITKEQERVLLFDMNTGKWIGEVGKKGKGPGEHISPSSLHIEEEKDLLLIADKGLNKLLYYRLSDLQYIRTKKISPFFDCCWLKDGKIAWVFVAFNDDKRNLYNIKITDENLEEISFLYKTDFCPQYQMTLGRFVYEHKGDYYLNLPFEPTVYRIEQTAVVPVYNVNYGKYTFASHDWLLENATASYHGALFHSDFISVHRVLETDTYVSTVFLCGGAKVHIGFYRKTDQSASLLTGTEFMEQSGLVGMAPLIGTYDNYFITLLAPSSVKKKAIRRKDLRLVAEQVSEEDNPILCFFKIK